MSAHDDDPALICVVDAIPLEERALHRELIVRLFGDARRHGEKLPDGYVFRFAAGRFADVAAFIVNEMRCCPFLRFEIDIPSNAEVLLLRLTGPAGTARFLEAELGF